MRNVAALSLDESTVLFLCILVFHCSLRFKFIISFSLVLFSVGIQKRRGEKPTGEKLNVNRQFFKDFLMLLCVTYLSVFSPNAGKCWKNADQNNSEYGILLRSVLSLILRSNTCDTMRPFCLSVNP